MNPIQKKRLPENVADALRQRIESGAFKEKLPGVRMLARSIGVSVPTVCAALRSLESEGLLDGGGSRRRWQVKPESSMASTEPHSAVGRKSISKMGRIQSGRLLFVSSLPLSHERHSGVEVFAEMLDMIGVKGWEIMHRVADFTTARKPRKSWDELLAMSRPDALVVLGGTPVIAEWAVERNIRTLFLGGDTGTSGIPMLAVKASTMLRYALDHLLTLDHRRILMPLCGRSPGFVAGCRTLAAEMAGSGGKESGRIVIAESAYARPEVIVDLLRRQWKMQIPDALVLLDWREFIAASGYFRECGIEIPRDLSVVILSQNSSMDWHFPRIDHFEHPVKQMARMISKWLTDGKGLSGSQVSTEVHAKWVPGQSTLARS